MFKNNTNMYVKDIQKEYKEYREKGETRESTLAILRRKYQTELEDEDDRLFILLGLVLALCKKKELIKSIADELTAEIHCLRDQSFRYGLDFEKVEHLLKQEELYGKEAEYKYKKRYTTNWSVGDLFCHKLTHSSSQSLGITNWYILFYKVSDYLDEFDIKHELVCISICPPNEIPTNKTDLEKLGFLYTMKMGDHKEHLAQITIKTKKDEEKMSLIRIGNYPNVALPKNCLLENPLTAMPLFGVSKKKGLLPGYEEQICRLYQKNFNV